MEERQQTSGIPNNIKTSMKNTKTALRVLFLTAVILFHAADFSAQTLEQKPGEKPLLPDLVLPSIDGQKWSLHKNRGKIVVLNFWATWCEPCRTEIPLLVKLADEYEKQGLKVVGVALDEDTTETVRNFIAEYKIEYPILIPPAGSPLSNVENVPMTILVDPEGRLAEKYIGAMPEKVLRRDIEKLTEVRRVKEQ